MKGDITSAILSIGLLGFAGSLASCKLMHNIAEATRYPTNSIASNEVYQTQKHMRETAIGDAYDSMQRYPIR